MYQCGFIGCGNMGSALALAASRNLREGLGLSNPTREKAQALAAKTGAAVCDNRTLAQQSKMLVLGVKPQVLPGVLKELAPVLKARTDRFLLISMAAGVSMEQVAEAAGGDWPVIRILPNTAVAIGEGMTLYCKNDRVTDDELAEFLSIFRAAGRFDALPERLIDAGSGVSGCGGAFAYLFLEALADGGVECGLPRQKALEYAAQTLVGAGMLYLRTGQHPGALKDAVCSPGGTTIAGVHALEDKGFRGAVMDAVCATLRRTQALKNGTDSE